jgi:O-antigen ligase/polysaccharide polymerase Wzy-like membrane protein
VAEAVAGRNATPWARPDRREWFVSVLGAFSLLALLAAMAPDFLALAAVVLIVVVIGWMNLELLVYSAVFLIPWQIYMMNLPGSTYTFRLEDVIIAVATLFTAARFPNTLRICLTGWMIPVLLFVAIAVGEGLSHGDAYATGKFIADWWPTVALYWVLLAWKERIDFSLLTQILLLSFCLQAFLGLVQTVIGDPDFIYSALRSPIAEIFFDRDTLGTRVNEQNINFVWKGRGFAFGTYLAATGFAVVLAGTAVMAWAEALGRHRSFRPALMWIAGAILFLACLLTLKRTGFLAALAGILTIVLSRRGQGISGLLRRAIILATAALLTLGLFHWKKEDVGERITDQSGSAYSRENILPLYLGLALQRPVFGYGPAYPLGSEGTGYWEEKDYQFGPENSYLHVALTAGLVGLALFLWQFGFGLRRLWASSAGGGDEALAIAAGLAACAVGGLFVIAVGDLKGSGLPFYLLAWAHQCVPRNRVGGPHRVAH